MIGYGLTNLSCKTHHVKQLLRWCKLTLTDHRPGDRTCGIDGEQKQQRARAGSCSFAESREVSGGSVNSTRWVAAKQAHGGATGNSTLLLNLPNRHVRWEDCWTPQLWGFVTYNSRGPDDAVKMTLALLILAHFFALIHCKYAFLFYPCLNQRMRQVLSVRLCLRVRIKVFQQRNDFLILASWSWIAGFECELNVFSFQLWLECVEKMIKVATIPKFFCFDEKKKIRFRRIYFDYGFDYGYFDESVMPSNVL